MTTITYDINWTKRITDNLLKILFSPLIIGFLILEICSCADEEEDGE